MESAHVSVPPLFGEVVLSDACESANWVKYLSRRICFLWIRGFSRQERTIYGIYEIWESKKREKNWRWLKIGHHKFSAWKWNFIPEKGHSKRFGPRQLFPSIRVTNGLRQEYCQDYLFVNQSITQSILVQWQVDTEAIWLQASFICFWKMSSISAYHKKRTNRNRLSNNRRLV